MTVYSDSPPVSAAPVQVIDGTVIADRAARARADRLSELFFFAAVLIAQGTWLGLLGYLAIRFL